MSARPDVPRLAEEDLDLLISRSLDGDLSPEEEQQLERLVALDPAAARRKGELAALVADVKALPEPATPFALATRVNGNVAERAGRPGSLGGRFGFFPAPGFAKAALVLLAIVGAAIAILRPVPNRMAEGPVDVFLVNPQQQPASPAPQTVIAEAKPESKMPARLDENARRQEADELRKEAPAGESVGKSNAEKKTAAKLEQASASAPAVADSSNVLAYAVPKQKADREDGAARGGAVALEAPAKIASATEPAAIAPAPALRSAEGGRATKAAAAGRGWTISVVGDARNRWSLRRAPDNPPPAAGAAVMYRVGLDASGRVAALRAVGRDAPDPNLDEFVRGMVFEALPQAAGAMRDKLQKDAPAPATTEIEIELAPR